MAGLAALIYMGLLLSSQLTFAESVKLVPKIWLGEELLADEGLLYLQSAIIDTQAQSHAGSFAFSLTGKQHKSVYRIQLESILLGQHPEQIFKLKVDDYQVSEVQMIDRNGKGWLWPGPYHRDIIVRGRSLSNGGIWYLVQLKQRNILSFIIKSSKNVFNPAKSLGSIARIIDGQTGHEVLGLNQTAPKRSNELRQLFSSKRTIGLFFKLNLFRQNQFAASVLAAIQSEDLELRQCYTDFLDRGSKSQGSISFTLLMSEQTRGIKTLKLKKSDFRDEKFMECLYYRLKALSLPVVESTFGELVLIFESSDS